MRKDAELNNIQILRITETLFQHDKLGEIGMREIAKEAGIGIGTLYRHYPTKSDLYLALVYCHLDQFLTQAERDLITSSTSTSHTFNNFLHQYLNFRESNVALLMQVEQNFQLGQQFYQSSQFNRLVSLIKQHLGKLLSDEKEDTLTFKAEMLIAMLTSDIYAYERTIKGHSQNDLIVRLLSLLT